MILLIALRCALAFDAESGNASHGHVLVGAIPWDAWHGPASEVGLAVEKTLAPAQWHYRLPFYGKVAGENVVEARGNSREIMDHVIAYADAAGLNYWDSVLYPEEHALSLGLEFYLSSERKLLVNSCKGDGKRAAASARGLRKSSARSHTSESPRARPCWAVDR